MPWCTDEAMDDDAVMMVRLAHPLPWLFGTVCTETLEVYSV